MKLVSVSEMKEMEAGANARGLSYDQMMQNAGLGIAKYILANYANGRKTVTGLVGTGNNGGDTLVALAALAKSGWQAKAYIVKSRPASDPIIKWFSQVGGQVIEGGKDPDRKILKDWLGDSDLLLDGVLGTGIKLPLKGEISEFFGFVSKLTSLPKVIAIDCPSGIDCDTGAAAPECIKADVTLCIAAVKQGMVKFPAFNYVKRIELIDIGFSGNTNKMEERIVVDPDIIKAVIPIRPMNAHKGTFGTVLIVAGSINYVGAAKLSGNAAYRVGSGLVQLGVIQPLQLALAGSMPETIWMILPSEEGVISADAADVVLHNIDKMKAILIGPGLGTEEPTQKFIEKLLSEGKMGKKAKSIGFIPGEGEKEDLTSHALPPMIIDADGLKLLAKIKEWWKKIPAESILTPHPGEMAVLTGMKVEDIQAEREGFAVKYAKEWGHVVVLKGALTIIAAPDGRNAIIPIATSALAKAGTGDVLAGMICGLRGEGMNAFEAAFAAAYLHGQAGLIAARKFGSDMSVMAGDVLKAIPDAVKEL